MFDNIIETIFTLMQNEYHDTQKQSDLVEFYYDRLDEKDKKTMDDIMISVCGYSLDTIINHPDNIQTSDD